MASSRTTTLAATRLESYGLSLELAKQLHIEILDAAETQSVDPAFKALPSLRLRYMDPANPGRPLTPHPKWPAFQRFRYLEDPPPNAQGKVQRYVQPSSSGVCAYFPSLFDWRPVLTDPTASIFITEGEFKAAKACERGFLTIGLGGVWNFTSKASGGSLLRELDSINWVQREVYIVYDNDGQPKEEVIQALNRLAEELCERGALIYTLFLPSVKPGKTGLDDYFAANPDPAEFGQLVLLTRISLTMAQPLHNMNTSYTLLHAPQGIGMLSTGKILSLDAFSLIEGKHNYREGVLHKDNTLVQKKVPLSSAWLRWSMRRESTTTAYIPGSERLVDQTFNTWPGWGTRPVKGDVGPFLRVVDNLFDACTAPKDEIKAAKKWFVQWLAFPIQNPGVKMFSMAVLLGAPQIGKSLLVSMVSRVYGANFHQLSTNDLTSQFNGWAAHVQFALGDDIIGSDKRAHATEFKTMITRDWVVVNEKNIPAYKVRDCINYIFTTNEFDAFFMDDDDRRNFIWHCMGEKIPLAEGKRIREWSDSEVGGNALHHYLLYLSLDGFDHTPAMMTTAKMSMTDLGKSDLDQWCQRLRDTPDLMLAGRVGDLFTSRELLRMYDPNGLHKVTPNGMGKALSRAKFVQVLGSNPVVWTGGNERFYIVRDAEKWLRSNHAQVRAHIQKTKPKPEPVPRQYKGVS